MTKYIDADAHLDNMFSTIDSFGDCFKQATYRGEPLTIAGVKTLLRESLRNTPAADVVEVVHARWKESDFIPGMLTCTNCGAQRNPKFKLGGGKWNLCPNCGATMDKEEE